jgi:hypothetical protein
MKLVLFAILFIIQMTSAAPAQYTILPTATPPVIDGNLTEWNDTYFIDSLRSDDNIFARDALTPWDRANFQYMVYAAHKDSIVYFAIKQIADNVIILGNMPSCDDAWKINPGGKATSFYMFFNARIWLNPSCPFTQGSTLFATVIPNGNGNLPTAEFSLDLNPYHMNTFQLSVGFEEGDTPPSDCNDTHAGGIGVEYQYSKSWDAGSQWDNPMYYPTFTLGQVKSESYTTTKAPETLTAAPNPFTPSTTFHYNVKTSGSLKIFDMSGKEVKRFDISGAGRAVWDATGLASGVYLARLISGKDVLNTRLFLIR